MTNAADLRGQLTRNLADAAGRPLDDEEAACALEADDDAAQWQLVAAAEARWRSGVAELRRAVRTELAGPGFEIWASPAGIPHLVPVRQDRGPIREPVTGPCVTCGLQHDVLHFRNVRVYGAAGGCVTETGGWPYDCQAKDDHPGHDVYYCRTHGVWWHQTPAPAPGRSPR